MAEAVVSLVVEQMIPFLIEEAKLLKGVRGELVAIKDEMESIRFLLRDADERAEIDEDVKVWVKQLRQVAFRMEDVMDEFRFRVAQQPPHNEGVVGCVTFGCGNRLKPRHILSSEIKDIKATLMQISERKERYQLRNLAPGSDNASSSTSYSTGAGAVTASWRNVNSRYVDDVELVGIEKPRNQLTDWLVKGTENRSVFAVVGTGGVGKTTLVRKVFDSHRVKSRFQYSAWVTVSQRFKIEDLLMELIKQFRESRKESFSPARMEMTYLIDVLRNFLQNKRYVAIVDDVWSTELWDFLKHALFDNHCGSRIIVTTRDNGVALSFVESPSHIFCLDPLPLEDALILFNKTAFGTDFNEECPLELEELSKDIVKRSGGLPLAIVTIGGLLLTKDKTVMEWKKFHDSLSSKVAELETIMSIISLSYHDLPYYLKSCFLFFGQIPEDCTFPSYKLISLWIAEGFVKEETGKTLEEIAKHYLDQLVSRNLVQGDEIQAGLIVTCKVHDLMHEFILSRITEEKFCEVFDGRRTPISHESCRRLSIQSNTGLTSFINSPSRSFSLVRSVHMFGVDELPISFVCTIIYSLTQLKILDLSGTLLESFPEEISDMFHLRYLDLSDTYIKTLPNSIGELLNLETLFLAGSHIVELPLGILKLRKLRHITAGHKNKAIKVPEGIGSLTELQTLYIIDLEGSSSLIKDLERLVKLRDIRITNLRAVDEKRICAAVTKMNRLKTLSLFSKRYEEEEEVLDLQFLSSPPPHLLSLDLRGPLKKLPDWVVSHSNLIYLSLDHSRLSHDALNILRGLSNLQVLSFQNHAYVGEELHFQGTDFPKLKDLTLVRLEQLQSVIIEKGAMPLLKEITIAVCRQLKEVPLGIVHLSNLKDLTIIDMPIDFKMRLEENVGEDYWKVKHVPSIVIK